MAGLEDDRISLFLGPTKRPSFKGKLAVSFMECSLISFGNLEMLGLNNCNTPCTGYHHVLVTITIYRPWINGFWIYVYIYIYMCVFVFHTSHHVSLTFVVVPPVTSRCPRCSMSCSKESRHFVKPVQWLLMTWNLSYKQKTQLKTVPRKIETSTNHQRWQGFKMLVDSGGFPSLLGFV